jgi:hypothetical protein
MPPAPLRRPGPRLRATAPANIREEALPSG